MADLPIKPAKTISGNQPAMRRMSEAATQTFIFGAILDLDGGANVAEHAAIAAAGATILGVAAEFGHNLTTAGTPKELTYGKVENQASAVLIPVGAPPDDGKQGLWVANLDTYFLAKVRDADTTAATDVGSIFGLTKNANGYWEVDKSKTTVAGGAVVTIVEVVDAVTAGGKVIFVFNQANLQLSL